MTDAWSLVGAASTGVVVAAVVGVVGALIGARVARRDEHSKWLRNQRLKANKAFYDGYLMLYLANTNPSRTSEMLQKAVGNLGDQNVLALLGPESVSDASDALTTAQNVWLKSTNDTTKAAMEAAETTYVEAARKSIIKG